MTRQLSSPSPARIKVIGVGGGGCNAVQRMVKEGIQGVEFIALNTDVQALDLCDVPIKMQLGGKFTKGLGAGGDPERGHKAAEESKEEIRPLVAGADMIFVTAGMGGGTGTGGAPVIAEMAKEAGALTIAIVTKPFNFEGAHRKAQAEEGISRLQSKVDTLIMIPNDRLLALCDHKVLMDQAFKMADDVLRQAVQSIAEVITVPGMINLDFADVKAIMKDAGPAWMSIGSAKGQNRAIDAAKAAIASPLLDVSIEGAKGVLFSVAGGGNLTLHEVNEAAEVIGKAVDPDANIIFGVVFDQAMEEEISITLIATGFVSKTGTQKMSEEDVRQMMKAVEDENELDVPAFMRRPVLLRRQHLLSQGTKEIKKDSGHEIIRPKYMR